MTTGTIVMIVCVVLYGLIVVFFKEDKVEKKSEHSMWWDDPFVGSDGTPGACGLNADDFDTDHPE